MRLHQLKRREFITLIGVAAVPWPLAAAGGESADHLIAGRCRGYSLEPLRRKFCAVIGRIGLGRRPHGRDRIPLGGCTERTFRREGRKTMAIYIMLASFTDQGIRKVSDSPKRTDAFKEMAKKCGATVRDAFWTLGEYDMVAIVEAPDDISMTALGLSSGALGNVRTQTLRAFTQADMKTIVGKMVKG
jgi:uncharacterized protein with GYD domain